MSTLRPLKRAIASLLDGPGWLERVPDVKDVTADGRLVVRGPRTELSRLTVRFRSLEARAHPQAGEAPPSGHVFAEWTVFSFGLAMDGGKRDWKLTRSRRSFAGRTGSTELLAAAGEDEEGAERDATPP